MPLSSDHSLKPFEVAHTETRGERSPSIPDPIAARRPLFLANRRSDADKLRDALAVKDFASIRHIGHNSKGIGAGYGFPDISRIGSAIETAAKASDVVEAEKAIEEFERFVKAASAS